MKFTLLIRTAVIGGVFGLLGAVAQGQVIGGAPKAGGSTAGTTATPDVSASPGAIESARDTNRRNPETAATGDKKAAAENKAEDAEKSKVKKEKKQKKSAKSEDKDEKATGEKPAGSPKAEPSASASPY